MAQRAAASNHGRTPRFERVLFRAKILGPSKATTVLPPSSQRLPHGCSLTIARSWNRRQQQPRIDSSSICRVCGQRELSRYRTASGIQRPCHLQPALKCQKDTRCMKKLRGERPKSSNGNIGPCARPGCRKAAQTSFTHQSGMPPLHPHREIIFSS